MSRVQVVQIPPEFCRFSDTAFERMVGTSVDLRFGESVFQDAAMLVVAEVIEGGYAVRLTLDIPDGSVRVFNSVALPAYTIESKDKGS